MSLINGIAQIALSVTELPRATAFYRDMLGLKLLFDAPSMSFFDIGGARLMLSAQGGPPGGRGTILYFKVDDIGKAHADLSGRGVQFEQAPHVVGRTPTSEVMLAFCTDPDGNLLGLMSDRPLTA
ncbi:MAG TPA: VOC family protein [Rhodanobacteraceae bacterium]|nr:VOC family protein [Rhodanobacteraceae bacterium]